jgi:hypothetical protein
VRHAVVRGVRWRRRRRRRGTYMVEDESGLIGRLVDKDGGSGAIDR